MLGLGPLVLVVIVVAVAYAVARASRQHAVTASGQAAPVNGAARSVVAPPPGAAHAVHAGPGSADHMEHAGPGLADDLARWESEGLVSGEQAAAILAWERSRAGGRVPEPTGPRAPAAPGPRRRVPVVAEALGYLGGTLGVVGLVLIVSRYWPDMATAGRVALSAAGALALLGAGALVREQADPALARLRWFLWLGSAGATALCAGVVVADGIGTDAPEAVAAVSGAAVAVHSGLLWWGHERPLQQLAALGGLAVAAGATVDGLAGSAPGGLAVWALGLAYLALGLRGALPLTVLTVAVGAVTAVVGAAIAAGDGRPFGLVLGVVTALGLLAVAAVPGLTSRAVDQRVTAIVGGLGLSQAAPAAIGYFAEEAGAATGLVVWLMGGLLIAAGARRVVRLPEVTEALGAVAMLGGAALTGAQWATAAPVFGLVTAVGLLALGMLPGRVMLSVLGALGLLVNVPWAIGRLFPGEGRAPVLILVTGVVLIGVAVLLGRSGGRLRRELVR